MIMTVIIISAIISVIMVRVAVGSLASLNNFNINLASAKINNLAETCANEALLALSRDEAYPGASLTYSGGACTTIITGTDNNREIIVNAIDTESRAKSITIEVTLSPFTIANWE